MELVAWRLENEADPRIGHEVEPDLVRRARCSAGDRAGKAPVDCAVQVAAQDAFDLGMACDDFGKSRGIVEAEIVRTLLWVARSKLNSLPRPERAEKTRVAMAALSGEKTPAEPPNTGSYTADGCCLPMRLGVYRQGRGGSHRRGPDG